MYMVPGRAPKQGRDTGKSNNRGLSKDNAPEAEPPPRPSFPIPSLLNPSDKQRLCKTVSLIYVCCFKPVSKKQV